MANGFHPGRRGYPQEVRDRYIGLMVAGVSSPDAAAVVGVSRKVTGQWWRQATGMSVPNPRRGPRVTAAAAVTTVVLEGQRGRFLNQHERDQIMCGLRAGWSYARIGTELDRDRSVIWREVRRNTALDGCYYAGLAQAAAVRNARRPKEFRLVTSPQLVPLIEGWMDDGWSPKLISQVLRRDFGDDQAMQISHETIYQCLYVQTRGELRKDLSKQLSLQRSHRRSRADTRTGERRGKFNDAYAISDRPAEVADRAVPGHWEGDLIIGKNNNSGIGTLVERTTRFTLLLHLPHDRTAESVTTAMVAAMKGLPEHLRRTITWDRGSEIAAYERIQMELGTPVYLCDPHSPWQRGTNENTNRLLRHWFHKGTDLGTWTAEDLKRIQDTLNRRPRPTLDLQTPAQKLNELLNNQSTAA